MKDTDRGEFSKAFASVAVVFGRDVTKQLIDAYFQALKDKGLESVIAALAKLVQTATFMPKPAEIRQAIEGGTAEELAAQALGELERAMSKVGPYNSIVFSDRCITAAVRDLGGWQRVCEWTEDDWPWRSKEFRELYTAYKRAGVPSSVPAKLLGSAEITNRAFPEHKPRPQLWGDNDACIKLLGATVDRSGEVIQKLKAAANAQK